MQYPRHALFVPRGNNPEPSVAQKFQQKLYEHADINSVLRKSRPDYVSHPNTQQVKPSYMVQRPVTDFSSQRAIIQKELHIQSRVQNTQKAQNSNLTSNANQRTNQTDLNQMDLRYKPFNNKQNNTNQILNDLKQLNERSKTRDNDVFQNSIQKENEIQNLKTEMKKLKAVQTFQMKENAKLKIQVKQLKKIIKSATPSVDKFGQVFNDQQLDINKQNQQQDDDGQINDYMKDNRLNCNELNKMDLSKYIYGNEFQLEESQKNEEIDALLDLLRSK
ncbi:Hypothetical_protein [Hexamita inflata]|uniref:Hypothetical_protein n=1 Tax=Hexamita inflata TaxID=28002 RepID=A0AA86NVN6_9EUKA|nr:Hypothetical protein HINF_LOCUS14136 [Hexamita inflata]